MTPQLTQVAHFMNRRGRIVRHTPVSGLRAIERLDQIDNLVQSLWHVAASVGVDLGRTPTAIARDGFTEPVGEMLESLSHLSIEVLATYHMIGLAPAYTSGIYEVTKTPPHDPPPNFTRIIDDSFREEEENNFDFVD